MAKRPRPSASQEDLQERDEAIDGKLLRYQIAQLGASLQARQEELQRLQSRVETLERELAEHDVAQKPELRPEWEPLVQAAVAARKVERLEQDLEDARQQLTQQRRLLVRLECGVSVTGTSTATDQAPVPKPDSSPASEQSSAPERNDTLAGTAAAEAPSSTSAGPQQVDTKQVSVLQSQVNELETRISLLAEELAQERELARAVREQLESSAREKAELASALQVAREQAQNPEPEVIRASATYKSMEAHLLILLRAEQKWSQDREALVRERDELLIRANQEQTVEKRELLSEIEKLKAKINEKNTETEWLKENVAKLQMMYEEKKKVAVDPVVLDETSRAVRQLQERNADLSTKLQSIRTAEASASEDASEYLAEIETLSSSLTKAEASIAQLTERLIEKEATLGKVLAERLKYIQQQLTLKEQLKVEANRAEKEHELSQQISHALTAARNQVSELQSQLEKMSSEMRIVRKQADIARLGAEKSAAEAYTQRQFAESAQSQVRRLSGELAQLRGQIEQQTEALRAADEAKTRSERRVSRLEHELELLRKRNAATSASDVDWQHEMIEDMRRKLYCTVCKAQEKQVTLLRCLHMFCRDCIQTNIANRNRKCPLCGEKFGTDDVKPIFFV